MIAKSDIVILALASSILAVGVYRWSGNVEAADARVVATTTQSQPAPAVTAVAPTVVATLDAGQAVADVQPAAPDVTEINLPQADNTAATFGTHTVASGEYLGLIAETYNTTVASLREINALDDNLILVGQEIRYPLPSP